MWCYHLCCEFLEKYLQFGGIWRSSGLGFTSSSTDTEEPACTFLSRCFAYLCAICGSWKTSLKILVICTGCISGGCTSGASSIVFCGGVEGGGVLGQMRLIALENRRRQPERGFLATCFTVPVTNLKVFPIRYTQQPSAIPATSSIIMTAFIMKVVGGTGQENP